MCCNENDLWSDCRLKRGNQFEHVLARHLDIQKDDVGNLVADAVCRSITITTFCHYFDIFVGGQKSPYELTGEGFIINNERANLRHLALPR